MNLSKKQLIWIAVLFTVVATTIFSLVFVPKILKGAAYKVLNRTESWHDEDGEFYKEVAYGDDKHLYYNLYIPEGTPKENQGAILLIRSGAWIPSSLESLEYLARKYAKEGYITATMNYSTLSTDVTMDTLLNELDSCISHIKDYTAGLGYDVNKMALLGDSSGGHLALLYSYSKAETSPLPITFVYDIVGPTDFNLESWSGSSYYSEEQHVADLVSQALGQGITVNMIKNGDAKAQIASISPLTYITENTIPTLLAYGGVDNLVPSAHYEKLIAALETNNVPHDSFILPNTDHLLYMPEDEAMYNELWNTSLTYLQTHFGY